MIKPNKLTVTITIYIVFDIPKTSYNHHMIIILILCIDESHYVQLC